ncbi:8-amino-7-oxononanoate synthase [Proteobacteria bacterium 005FR1]|nr:8-amino-7-oxononanoate synthase [Proteobacteria bacterium 005FR1]
MALSLPAEAPALDGQTSLERRLASALAERQAQHRYRRRSLLESPQGARVRVGGRDVVAFCSNDYLGLANHPKVIEAFQVAAESYGVGSGASHLICGHSEEHHLLEDDLAAFTGRERALLISTGYMANVGTLNALTDAGSTIFADRLNHASLMDGAFVSRARLQKFAHNDLADLETQLQSCQTDSRLIAVDGVYSMDGDLAPLPEMARLASAYDAALMVDDAHGFGWLGESGAGVAEHFGLGQKEVPVLMATLGKSLGSFGAFIAGSEDLIEYLVQFCRPYVYSTALPPAVAAATRASLGVIHSEPHRRRHLLDLIERFRAGARERGIATMHSATPIQPVLAKDERQVLTLADLLASRGFWVGAIRPPTVPAGSCRLRISLSADHSAEQVDALLDALQWALEQCR